MPRFIVHGKYIPNEMLYGYFNNLFSDWRWNWLIVLFKTFEITLNSLLNVRLSFGTSFSLRNAAGKSRTIGYEDPVLVLFDYHSKFHLDASAVYPPNGTMRGIF
jgi:hypothetical protein